ncbi:MAG TPA: kelch repeat-containing protein [Chitinophagaceae bacterium]|nr:kelch repeat-containing protein [Chitinophagaceae bacterium]
MTLSKKWILFLAPVFILGACKSDSTSTTDLVGDWVNRFSFNGVARSEAVSFTIGTKSYIGGGFDGVKRLNDFWEYDVTTGLWRKVKTFPGTARSGAIAFAIDSKGYVGTGIDDNGIRLNDFYEYTPGVSLSDSGTWVQKNNFGGTARQEATGFTIGTKGYVIAGYDGNYLKDFWEYTPGSDSWMLKAFPGNKRREATAFVINGKAYLATGINNGVVMNDFWEYDPAGTGNGWTKKRDISNTSTESYDDTYSITRSNGVSFVINNKGYVVGGENGATSDCWEYDPSGDVWTKKTPFEGAYRTGAVGASIDGKGFVLTGRNGNNPLDDFWQFLPDATKVDNN